MSIPTTFVAQPIYHGSHEDERRVFLGFRSIRRAEGGAGREGGTLRGKSLTGFKDGPTKGSA